MLRRNSRGVPIPDHLLKVALRVQKLTSRSDVREHWKARVLDWCRRRPGNPGVDPDATRPAGDYVPLPPELTEAEQYVVLAAIHDFVCDTPLGPNSAADAVSVPYIVLRLAVPGLPPEDAERLLGCADELQRVWRCEHSSDFSNVVWYGTEYHFSRSQADCIRVLWQNWEREVPEIFGDHLVKAAGVDPYGERPLGEVFRIRGKYHPAWRTMIVGGANKGSYRLAPPAEPGQPRSRKTRGRTRRSARPKG